MNNLKPCPFCGQHENEHRLRVIHLPEFVGHNRWSVHCDCGVRGSATTSRDKAVRYWNTRPLEQENLNVKSENERLKLQIARLTTNDFVDEDFLNEIDLLNLKIINLKDALNEALQNCWHEGDERWQYFRRLIEKQPPGSSRQL